MRGGEVGWAGGGEAGGGGGGGGGGVGGIKNSLRLVAHQQGRDMTLEEEKGGVDNDEEYQT